VDYRISPEDRASFKRCRRQWNYASPYRRNLEPVETPQTGALPIAFKEALAVYYYPGTWDWQRELKQSLVHKAMGRSLEQSGASHLLGIGADLLDAYDEWASSVDDFAPVKIDHDVVALVRVPGDDERGLTTADGAAVMYACRIDLLAVDAADEYWVVCHRVVSDWRPPEESVLDEQAVTACWAWEQDYLGMEVAGTIHNEIRLSGAPDADVDNAAAVSEPNRVAQHAPSGGGRAIPQHVRQSALAMRGPASRRIDQRISGGIRRTRIRRGRHEIAAAGVQLAADALEMSSSPAIYPAPGPHCAACQFLSPCLAAYQGDDPEPDVSAHFRHHVDHGRKPRLGQATWGFGRGAAPPDW
jgi:hypothetical protein